MWEKFKERAFGFASLGIGATTTFVFILMKVKGAAYIYENIQWILWTEMLLAAGYTLWAIERLIKDLK